MRARAGRALAVAALAGVLAIVPVAARGQCCGDCNVDGAVSIDELVKAVTRALAGCADDGVCRLDDCATQLATCQGDLAECRAHPAPQRLPASGQTTAFGPGSDGDVRAGAPLAYTDNGDGTITDDNTGLIWEKKDHGGGVHDVDKRFSWGANTEPFAMDGTIVSEFLATLNTPPCFAGSCDWRIPNIKELQTLVDYENLPASGPVIDAAFNANCVAGCTADGNGAPVCSCSASFVYWSSTTGRGVPMDAWIVDFDSGIVAFLLKNLDGAVRAVRERR